MSGDPVVVRLDAERHRAVQALLPWHAAGTLDAAEAALVEAHLGACPLCQAELAFEHKLRLALQEEADLEPAAWADVEAGLARLAPRLEARAPRLSPRAWLAAAGRALDRLRAAWRDGPPLLRAAFAVQGGAVLAVALALALQAPPPYRALGSAPVAAPATLLVMFRDGTTEAQLRATLAAGGARIVDGPTAAGAWLLAVPPGREAAALAALRAQPAVALAQPLAAEPAR